MSTTRGSPKSPSSPCVVCVENRRVRIAAKVDRTSGSVIIAGCPLSVRGRVQERAFIHPYGLFVNEHGHITTTRSALARASPRWVELPFSSGSLHRPRSPRLFVGESTTPPRARAENLVRQISSAVLVYACRSSSIPSVFRWFVSVPGPPARAFVVHDAFEMIGAWRSFSLDSRPQP